MSLSPLSDAQMSNAFQSLSLPQRESCVAARVQDVAASALPIGESSQRAPLAARVSPSNASVKVMGNDDDSDWVMALPCPPPSPVDEVDPDQCFRLALLSADLAAQERSFCIRGDLQEGDKS